MSAYPWTRRRRLQVQRRYRAKRRGPDTGGASLDQVPAVAVQVDEHGEGAIILVSWFLGEPDAPP
jgi:hypothetical protein